MNRLNKNKILDKLKTKEKNSEAIIVCAAGNGLIARLEEKNGADIIIVYNSGLYRMNGIASIAGNLPIGDANQIVYDMGKKSILPMVKNTPVAAGIYGVDPTRDMHEFLEEIADIGYSAVINFPTIGKLSGSIREELENVGLGFKKEVETLKIASKLNFLTLAYCYCEEEARILAEADIDIIVAHTGLTSGGDVGVKGINSLDSSIKKTQQILSAAMEVKPEIIKLCHGGSIVTPEDLKIVLNSTCASGFVAASSIERIPIEDAVKKILNEFTSVKYNK